MTANTASEKVWAAIDEEKRRDRFIRRVCKSAWIVTFVAVLLLGAIYGVLIAQMVKLMGVGAVTWLAVASAATRVFIVVGILSVLVATLSTVGIFLRMRTTSLTEIQLRLAALEEMVSGHAGGQ
jgi:hypothetical protein